MSISNKNEFSKVVVTFFLKIFVCHYCLFTAFIILGLGFSSHVERSSKRDKGSNSNLANYTFGLFILHISEYKRFKFIIYSF